ERGASGVGGDERVSARRAECAGEGRGRERAAAAEDLMQLFDRERGRDPVGYEAGRRAPGRAADGGSQPLRGGGGAVEVPLALGVRIAVVEADVQFIRRLVGLDI